MNDWLNVPAPLLVALNPIDNAISTSLKFMLAGIKILCRNRELIALTFAAAYDVNDTACANGKFSV
jgi:hypothetical protein